MTSPAGLGIPQLDLLLGQPPAGATLLLLNDPGVEAEPFLYQAAHHHLAAGRTVVYATTARAPRSALRAMKEHGFAPERLPGKLLFLDAFSALMGSREEAAYAVPTPGGPVPFAAALERAAQEHPDAVLMVESLSTLIDTHSLEAFGAALPRIVQAMGRFRLTAALFTKWPYADDLAPLLGPFQGLVRLRAVEDRVMLSQYFALERAAWLAKPDTKPRMYKVAKPGGVLVYVPKVVVTGPHNAGKSTFVHAVAEHAASADQLGTTVALDHGSVTIDGLTTELFGTPGQARFDPIVRSIASHALGVIVVVDATEPDTFARAKEMIHLTWKEGLPCIIAANKQDQPGALPAEQVARAFEGVEGFRVLPCTARDAASARGVLRALLRQILEGPVPEPAAERAARRRP